MSEYFDQYLTVLAFGAFGAILVGALLGVASIIRPNDPTPAKLETYESGIDPVGGGWSQTHIRYYVFAFLFLIFDVEAVFIFPWALELENLGAFALWEMVVFIGILVMGLLYTITRTVFELELSVHIAKIGTYLDQVVDVFYVTDRGGAKILDERRIAEIQEQIHAALDAMVATPQKP